MRMWKLVLINSLILVAVFWTGIGLLSWRQNNHDTDSPPHEILDEEVYSLLKPGDIIMRRGRGFFSDNIIRSLNDSAAVSHVALLNKKNDEWQVIHSISRLLSETNGIQTQALKDFHRHSRPGSTIIVRYRSTDSEIEKMIQKAENLLALQLPFDNSFNLENNSSIYCSELIYRILPEEFQTGALILRNMDIISFDSFLNPDFFEIIVDMRSMIDKDSGGSLP